MNVMRYFRYIFYVIALCTLVCCNRNSISPEEQAFEETDSTPALLFDGVQGIVYEENGYQSIFLDKTNTFCITSDDTKTYFKLSCSAFPASEEQKLTASLQWCLNNRIKEKNSLEFIVKKIDTKAVWLWCRSLDIGVVVPQIR